MSTESGIDDLNLCDVQLVVPARWKHLRETGHHEVFAEHLVNFLV